MSTDQLDTSPPGKAQKEIVTDYFSSFIRNKDNANAHADREPETRREAPTTDPNASTSTTSPDATANVVSVSESTPISASPDANAGESRLSGLTRQNLQLKHGLQMSNAARTTLEQQLSRMEQEFARVEGELEAAKDSVKKGIVCEERLSRAQIHSWDLRVKLMDGKTAAKEAQEAAEKMQEELSRMQKLESKLEKQILELQTRVEELIASNAAQKETIKSQISTIGSLRPTRILDLEQTVQGVVHSNAAMHDTIKSMIAMVSILPSRLAGLAFFLFGLAVVESFSFVVGEQRMAFLKPVVVIVLFCLSVVPDDRLAQQAKN